MTRKERALRLVLFTSDHADDLLSWQYQAPYNFYDPPQGNRAELLAELTDPSMHFHAIEDEQGLMLGYCSYGNDGQLAGYDYQSLDSAQALDIGLGMRPNLTGQGLGRIFFAAILAYAIRRYQTNSFRLTVAGFNQRAIKLYRDFGFCEIDRFNPVASTECYCVMAATIQQSDLLAASQLLHARVNYLTS